MYIWWRERWMYVYEEMKNMNERLVRLNLLPLSVIVNNFQHTTCLTVG
jgi:hypothetical protein